MSGELLPRSSHSPASRAGRPTRAMTKLEQVEAQRTALAVARVNRVAVTSQVALMRIGELSELEAQLTRMCPLGEHRYRAIVDAATLGVTQIINQQAWE